MAIFLGKSNGRLKKRRNRPKLFLKFFKIHGKLPMPEFLFNKFVRLRFETLSKKRHQYRFFFVNFATELALDFIQKGPSSYYY